MRGPKGRGNSGASAVLFVGIPELLRDNRNDGGEIVLPGGNTSLSKGMPFFDAYRRRDSLQGCGGSSEQPPGAVLENVSFAASLDANENTAVSMDLVMVYEKNLLATIKKMTADQYFRGIDQIRLDNPEFLAIWRWELVPGQVGNYSLSPEKNAWGIVLFGDYQSPGDHRASVGAFSAISILVGNKDFQLKQETEPLSNKIIAAVPVPLSTPLNTRSPVPPEEPPDLLDTASSAQESEASSSEPEAEAEPDTPPSSEEAPAGEESS